MHAAPRRRTDVIPAARTLEGDIAASRLLLRPVRSCGAATHGVFRDGSAARAHRRHGRRGRVCLAQTHNSVTTLASGGPRQGATTTTAPASSARTGGGGRKDNNPDPDNEPDSPSDSFQIGLDPFSQQLIASALTAVAAWAIASWAHLDLSSSLRPDGDALAVALQLSAPVLVLLLAVVAPRWAPPFKGSELARLRHNYYMTAQVLQLYLDPEDDDEEGSGSGSGSSWDDGGGGAERARVRRRLRLEQTVGWGTVSSGLALMQAFTLQPWNTPTANSVFVLALAGRSAQQLANEFLIRGAGWGLLSGWVAGELQSADASDGILFFGKVFGGPDAVKYAAGLALVALALPGALWEARAARNFVRASVVGPVRDAAIFCTGNGVDEPAYCDPKGFAMMAARRPANAAPVADVVTRTRGWRSGPQASYSSVSSMDMVDLPPAEEDAVLTVQAVKAVTEAPRSPPDSAATAAAAGARSPCAAAPGPATTAEAGAQASSSSSSSPSPSSTPPRSPESPPSSASSSSAAAAAAAGPTSGPAATTHAPQASAHSPSAASHSGDNSSSNNNCGGASPPSKPSQEPPRPSHAPAASSPSPATASSSAPSSASASSPLPQVGPTLSTSSAAFEWDSEDMGVLLRVETLQDKIALWSSLYYQLLAAFAINGAFLASDCNLLASLAAAWLLRTGPLLLSELRARRAADAAMR